MAYPLGLCRRLADPVLADPGRTTGQTPKTQNWTDDLRLARPENLQLGKILEHVQAVFLTLLGVVLDGEKVVPPNRGAKW
jgi:hypothetical protein